MVLFWGPLRSDQFYLPSPQKPQLRQRFTNRDKSWFLWTSMEEVWTSKIKNTVRSERLTFCTLYCQLSSGAWSRLSDHSTTQFNNTNSFLTRFTLQWHVIFTQCMASQKKQQTNTFHAQQQVLTCVMPTTPLVWQMVSCMASESLSRKSYCLYHHNNFRVWILVCQTQPQNLSRKWRDIS